jgi:hemoglobin
MSRKVSVGKVSAALAGAVLAVAAAHAGDVASVAEQMAALQKMCSDTEAERAQRHAAEALYVRLGGYERIHELTREVVRLHNENEAIKHMFVHVDGEDLARKVADFVANGTGGPQAYSGRDLPSSHETLHLTDADFLSAGNDIVSAMQTKGYGQNEIDEVVCILVSLKDEVVFE